MAVWVCQVGECHQANRFFFLPQGHPWQLKFNIFKVSLASPILSFDPAPRVNLFILSALYQRPLSSPATC